MYSRCAISVFVAQYITARGHTKVLHILKILLSAITLFSEPQMTSNRYPAGRFGRAQNGPTFDRQNTIFAASKLLDEIASGRLNPNIWDHWGINKHIRQNYFLVHIHFKEHALSSFGAASLLIDHLLLATLFTNPGLVRFLVRLVKGGN